MDTLTRLEFFDIFGYRYGLCYWAGSIHNQQVNKLWEDYEKNPQPKEIATEALKMVALTIGYAIPVQCLKQ